jgi:4-amino-4-deoxy-L-arabinose transferase-like glycosyltransferase
MFMTLSLVGWLLLPERKSGLAFWAAGITGGMLSAGIGGLFPLAAGLISASFDRRKGALLRRKEFWLMTLAAVAVGSVWVVTAILKSGENISANSLVWFGLGNFPGFSKASIALFKSVGKGWTAFLPWSIPATAAAVRILFFHKKKEKYCGISGTDYSLLAFTVVFFVSIAVIKPSYPGEFLPVLPALSILSAREMARWFSNLERPWSFNQAMVGMLCLLMLLLFITPLSLHRRETDSIELVAEFKAKMINENRSVSSFRMNINKYDKARFLFYGGWAPELKYTKPQEISQVVKKYPGRIFISSHGSLRDFEDTDLKSKLDIIYIAGDLVLFCFR